MSNPVCTACSKSPTSCSFHPAYEDDEKQSEDDDGISESEEEAKSRATSPAGSGGSGTPVVEKSEMSGTQPLVSEMLKFRLALIDPQSERIDRNPTEAPVPGIGRYGDVFKHHMPGDTLQHPFRYTVQ